MIQIRLVFVFFAVFAIDTCSSMGAIINVPPTVLPTGNYSVTSGNTLNIHPGADVLSSRLNLLDGSVTNVYGGRVRNEIGASDGSTLNIEEGQIQDLFLSVGSTTTMRGGRYVTPLHKQSPATLIMEGVDFAFNGVSVSGLDQAGDEVTVQIPENTLFTGIFSSGAPFTFFQNTFSGDRFSGDVILKQTARPTGPSVITLPTDPVPNGVLPGQTLILEPGAVLPQEVNAAPGSVVDIRGGDASTFEAYGAEVYMSGGTGGMTLYTGSSLLMSGGTSHNHTALGGSTVRILDGMVTNLFTRSGAEVEIQGGTVTNLDLSGRIDFVFSGGTIGEVEVSPVSSIQMLGGKINRFLFLPTGSQLHMSGGEIGMDEFLSLGMGELATLKLLGSDFLLDGVPIPGLVNPGDSLILDVTSGNVLETVLRDGTTVKLNLDPGFVPPSMDISEEAIIELRLVPEPQAAGISVLLLLILVANMRLFPVF